MRRVTTILAVLGTAALSTAQPPAAPAPPSTPTPPAAEAPKPISLDQLPPTLRLGVRVEAVRQRIGLTPAVVIVPDAPSYIAAISHWTIHARYPVLIDDGTWETQQDIARFVRAFGPSAVVRWSAPDAFRDSWKSDAASRRPAIEAALASAWEAESASKVADKWKTLGLTPPGVVVASLDDPAWTAGLALAAGHGQPILWLNPPGNSVDADGDPARIDAFCRDIEKGCEATGLRWNTLGDDLDAIALCVNCPARIALPRGDQRQALAVTDVVGRSLEGERKTRWAWASQIFGGESLAAYRAMCALFLQPQRAWLFDGYANSEGYRDYDCTAAAAELSKATPPLRTTVFDTPHQSAHDFRRAACGRPPPSPSAPGAAQEGPGGAGGGGGGLDAGLIFVNTQGNMDFFDLHPGRCLAGDVPLLPRPAIVYFVHSWSAMYPGARATIGARWLEHSAYAYLGSVSEPYLQAFVPTPITARRLAGHIPWAAAIRFDNEAPPWKLAAFGDPLLTCGPPAPRTPPPSPAPSTAPAPGGSLPPAIRDSAVNLETSLREALRDTPPSPAHLAEALRTLSLLGRDSDAARLLASVHTDTPAALTPEVALAGIESAYFAGRFDVVAAAGAAALPLFDKHPTLRDIVWHTLWPTLSTLRPAELELLRNSIRYEPPGNTQLIRDAIEVGQAIRAAPPPLGGEAAVRPYLDQLRPKLPPPHDTDDTLRQIEAGLFPK